MFHTCLIDSIRFYCLNSRQGRCTCTVGGSFHVVSFALRSVSTFTDTRRRLKNYSKQNEARKNFSPIKNSESIEKGIEYDWE